MKTNARMVGVAVGNLEFNFRVIAARVMIMPHPNPTTNLGMIHFRIVAIFNFSVNDMIDRIICLCPPTLFVRK